MVSLNNRTNLLVCNDVPERERRAAKRYDERTIALQGDVRCGVIIAANDPFRKRPPREHVEMADATVTGKDQQLLAVTAPEEIFAAAPPDWNPNVREKTAVLAVVDPHSGRLGLVMLVGGGGGGDQTSVGRKLDRVYPVAMFEGSKQSLANKERPKTKSPITRRCRNPRRIRRYIHRVHRHTLVAVRAELAHFFVGLCIPHRYFATIRPAHDPLPISGDCNAGNRSPRVHWCPHLFPILHSPTSNPSVLATAYDVFTISEERDRVCVILCIDFDRFHLRFDVGGAFVFAQLVSPLLSQLSHFDL